MIHEERVFPVEEMVAYEEFTDRVEILRELENWVKNIQRMAFVPANSRVRSLFRKTRLFVGTSIFRGVIISESLARRDETGWGRAIPNAVDLSIGSPASLLAEEPAGMPAILNSTVLRAIPAYS